jgi:ubiquinone/menaquinone biosynthesis C-methylase UbiE
MTRMKSKIFQGLDNLYTNENFLVRNLFWARIRTALDIVEINDHSTILDIGSASGQLLKSIRNFNATCECWAIDVLDSKITETIDCKFRIADVRKLPFDDGYFDIVFALDILEHIQDDVGLAIMEIRRVLKEPGVVILSGPTESIFYRFCRRILFLTNSKHINDTAIERKEIDFHYHTVHQLEKEFVKHSFSLSRSKSLPGFPLPPLFRICKFLV